MRMRINLSRANIYLVDDCDFIVAANEEQALQFSKEEYGEDCGETATLINGDKSYFIDDEIFIDDETKIDYLNENQGKSIENHKPLKMFDYEVVITKSFSFIARRTLQKQLEVSTGNGILFEVPFFLASTEV